MSLIVASLNSGSNGNCYYISNGLDSILIDGGLSCKETVKRMKRLGLSLRNVKAIFVSHEHGDHIHGVEGICKKFKLPLYITEATLQAISLNVAPELIRALVPFDRINIGSLITTSFPKIHDAVDPQSFVVENEGVRVGVFTDIGSTCENTIKHFKECHAAFLESNYDEAMLEHGGYPYPLKMRIRGGKGHLSNLQALKLFTEHKPEFMSHLFLSHLSHDNNDPKLVQRLFSQVAENTDVIIASRQRETKLYHIRQGLTKPKRRRSAIPTTVQLSFFN